MNHILKISLAAAAAVVLAASCQKEIPAPSVTLESSYEIVVGEELTITPVYKNCEGAVYTWTLNEQVIGNEASLVYTFPEAGDFAVSVSVETEGGNAQASTNVKVKENTAVLTFEGEYWDALIDDPQYGGPLLYGEYDEANYTYLGTDYSWFDDGNTFLASELCENYGAKVYWNGGHAVSGYVGQEPTGDYMLQLAIPLESGHNGSKNFCVHNGYKSGSSIATGYFYFKDGVGRIIESMYVTNTSYYLGSFDVLGTETDWTKITATGYDAEGTVTGTSEFYLSKDGESINEWTLWDLTGLGTPVKVEFDITSSMVNEWGMAIPGYFAYDDVTVRL